MLKTFGIGDIHGCLTKLRSLIALCEYEVNGDRCKFVFLGDYIDRGPDSRGVVEYLMALQTRMGDDAVFLRGNHEALALTMIDDDRLADMPSDYDEVMELYGTTGALELSAEHIGWLRILPFKHDDGRRLFVHAGVDPTKSLDAQDVYDLIWIREPFLSADQDYGRLIVHGHTPMLAGWPDLRVNRLNIDTGAVFGGPLTAAVFTDERTRPTTYLQAND
jgi:serine/threonine protein phosphatase 1